MSGQKKRKLLPTKPPTGQAVILSYLCKPKPSSSSNQASVSEPESDMNAMNVDVDFGDQPEAGANVDHADESIQEPAEEGTAKKNSCPNG